MTRLEENQLRFVNYRFGSFIHWNSASVQFHEGEISDWEYGVENGGAPRQHPFDEKLWNPTEFHPEEWATILKKAGCRFSALTTKHHEGFALWPTAYSEHCIRNATNKTDIVKAYLEAFRKEGIAAGLYFSVLDLTNRISRYHFDEESKKIVKGQLTELLTNYGEIPFLIIDGWNVAWGGPNYEELPFEEIDSLVKSIQPDCLVMNIGYGGGIGGTDILFFENGAGQPLPPDCKGPGCLCQKLTRTWFYRDDDPDVPTTPKEIALAQLQECNEHHVSYMLNLSPDKEGRIAPNLAKGMMELGDNLQLMPPLPELPAESARR